MVTDVEGSTMMDRRTARRPLALAAVAALVIAGCSEGAGVEYSEISGALAANCAHCHDSDETVRGNLLGAVAALANDQYDSTSFPEADFVPGLLGTTAPDHKNGLPAEHPEAVVLAGDEPPAKVWILHELYELDALLAEPVPPDYTTQAKFDAFAKFGNPGAYEGCEIGAKLDLGHAGDPEGMAPRWATKLLQLLAGAGGSEHAGYRAITPDERQKIREYVDQLLPGGLKACSPDAGSGS